MLQQPITIINKLGLHTRAAAKLVATAGKFESKIELKRNDHTIDAKSIMGVITLGATRDTTLEITISGADEFEALAAIVELINNRFGESE
ncbi:MAG: HPr family phosphocarrier protein [Gammaproteobacteria bacterium]|nr:HPr family phosphocarrier protein [Gammaproteobacteria bacterium]